MAVWLVLLILSFTMLILFVKYKQMYWRRRGVPHLEPHMLYGNLQEWRKSMAFHEVFGPIYRKFKGTGPFAGVYFLIRPAVLPLDLELIKNILIKDFNKFQDRGIFYNEIDDPLTGNLFQLDGPGWRALRHKLSPTFTSGKMRGMFTLIEGVAKELVAVTADKCAEATDSVLEITDLLSRFTADVIGLCAFGLECNSLRNPCAEFVVMGRHALIDRHHNYLIDNLMEAFPKLGRRLRLRQLPLDVPKFYMGIVRDTLKYRQENNVQRNDFMNMLIELQQKGELTVEEMAAQAFVFLLAGFETSSTTMGFLLYELAKNPEVQDKLRREVNDVLKRHKNVFSYECMQDMKYLEMVFSEALRKYPVLPNLERRAMEDYDTGSSKYMIEKGTMVVISVYDIHHDPSYYPDPEKFDPERFTEAEIMKRPTCSWIPFGDGPRNCIGLRFGKMQALIGLCHLVKNFKFSACDETPEKIVFSKQSVMLASECGIKLHVEKM